MIAVSGGVSNCPQTGQPSVPVNAAFASARYLTPKVRAFIDLAAQAMSAL
jgi:hypothetical protein